VKPSPHCWVWRATSTSSRRSRAATRSWPRLWHTTVRRVLRGERVIDPTLAAAALAEGANPLTSRERDVLAAAADGCANSEVAKRLHLSEGTVRNYLSAAIQKTTARNRTEAVRIAREKGWL